MKKTMMTAVVAATAGLLTTACCFTFNISDSYLHSERYCAGNGSTNQEITSIEIDWIGGSVDVRYGDDSTMRWEETIVRGAADCHTQMHYWIDGTTLKIHYCESGNWSTGGALQKKLAITLPKASMYDKLTIDAVSAGIYADIDAKVVDIETVSGSINLIDLLPAQDIDIETVSGSATLRLPVNSGFQLEYETVSGTFNTDLSGTLRGDTFTYGDGYTDIDVETVSGSICIYGAE